MRPALDLDALDGALARPAWPPPPVVELVAAPMAPPAVVEPVVAWVEPAPLPPEPAPARVEPAPRPWGLWIGAIGLAALALGIGLWMISGSEVEEALPETAPAVALAPAPEAALALAPVPEPAPPPTPAPPPEDWVVPFAYNRATLPAGLSPPLALRDCAAVQVTGYTCALGSDEANLALSQRRAEAVAGALEGLGIPADRLKVQGRGAADPLGDNRTSEGRRQNRRALVHCIP